MRFQSISCHGIKTQEDFALRYNADVSHQENRAETMAMPEWDDSTPSAHPTPAPPPHPPPATEIQFEGMG